MPDFSAIKGSQQGVVFFDAGQPVFQGSTALPGSPAFQVGIDMLKDGHYLLDISLATMRAFITAGPERLITVVAYTSPEQTRAYNQALSEARARTVSQAIFDAFRGAVTRLRIVESGLGEDPSLKPETRLTDPPNDPAGLQAFMNANKDQVDKWPEWRRAEVAVEGTVVVIGRTATFLKSVPGQP